MSDSPQTMEQALLNRIRDLEQREDKLEREIAELQDTVRYWQQHAGYTAHLFNALMPFVQLEEDGDNHSALYLAWENGEIAHWDGYEIEYDDLLAKILVTDDLSELATTEHPRDIAEAITVMQRYKTAKLLLVKGAPQE